MSIRKLTGNPVVLLDLDNCVSNDEWRIPHILWGHKHPSRRYHTYHSLAPFDAVGNEHLFDLTRYPSGTQLVVVTGRPNLYRPATEHWMRLNGIPAARLIMRADEDHRPSAEMKRAALRSMLFHEEMSIDNVVAAYDDHPEIVSMYRDEGVRHALIQSLHDVCAYTAPTPAKEQEA